MIGVKSILAGVRGVGSKIHPCAVYRLGLVLYRVYLLSTMGFLLLGVGFIRASIIAPGAISYIVIYVMFCYDICNIMKV